MAVFDGGSETSFYAECLRHLVFGAAQPPAKVAEFGSGSGEAVIAALGSGKYPVSVRGTEIDQESAETARDRIAAVGLEGQYAVTHGDFFAQPPEADCLVANPPFLPVEGSPLLAPGAADARTQAMLRQCDGGPTGTELSRRLLGLGYPQVMMLMCSSVNSVATFDSAREHGYSVVMWLARPGRLGGLARRVLPAIRDLQDRGLAFFLQDTEDFLMSGVLWLRSEPGEVSNAERLLVACMRGLPHSHPPPALGH